MQIVRELQLFPAMTLQQFRQETLMNGNLSAPQRSQLLLVVIDQDHLVAHVRKTGSRHQPHVA